MWGWIFIIIVAIVAISVIWNFLKNFVKEILVPIIFIIVGFCVWFFGAPQAAIILGVNEILAYIIFGIVDFFICLGVYARIKGEV